ncbi:MAG: glycosyltransferase family 4 protein [Spirochaetes bacterium]|nr:glycosyltransferase family 4 protein [Spirochaetota bacterium]
MTPVLQYYEGIDSVAVIGNYLPRQCGIATFTTDLVEAISAEAPDINCWAVVINDRLEGYAYPEKVRFEINQNKLSDYSTASEFLGINHMDIVCVQHEYGIFGGPAGSHLLKLLGELRVPVVTTLHTVLKDPAPEYREVMQKLSDLSDKLIVMSQKAVGFLKDIYNVPEEKIAFIHHGIPDTPFIDPNYYKDQFGVEGKKVMLTFGLLSPSKGIEYVLKAIPAIKKQHPDITYIILGATHPHVLKFSGEEYRISLQQLARKLDIREQVIFQNRFVELKELCEYLGCADIYITPYLVEAQITSGTLAYAMGTGKAVISTPYWYATEMLADGRGIIVPFKDPDAIAEQVIDVLSNDINRNTIRKKAYTFSREAIWKEVARKYLEVFNDAKSSRARSPRPRYTYIENVKTITNFDLPELKLDHLEMLTDDTGILQHAVHTVPNRDHGYCTDDNARALIVSAMAKKYSIAGICNLDYLKNSYLSFLQYAFNAEEGRFRNFMTYDRRWVEETGSEDAHGRALWSLGKAVVYLDHTGQMALATNLFNHAIKAVENFLSPRAVAFSLMGIHSYLQKFSGDSEARRIQEILADRLFSQFNSNAKSEWPWLEKALNYANGKLPHALLLSGQWTQNKEIIDMGLRSLTWLFMIQTESGHFSPIGNNGWYEENGPKARFDQQPIETHAMIEACIEAFNITGDRTWIDNAVLCFNWFLGHNDLNMSLYDPGTGGCRDGLMANGINQNEGAESTLAWLLSHMALQKLYADQILKQPPSRSNT